VPDVVVVADNTEREKLPEESNNRQQSFHRMFFYGAPWRRWALP
jgi:hypothetical protein